MTHSSIKTLMASDPSIRVVHSEASVSIVRRSSRFIQRLLIVVLVVTLGTVVSAILMTIKSTEAAKVDAKMATLKAQETRRINAQPMPRLEEFQMDAAADTLEEAHAYFSLFTAPEGAEVYRNDSLIGVTPIEQRVVKKELEPSKFTVVLDGYDIERLQLTIADHYSNTIELTERTVEVAKPKARSDERRAPRVTTNQAVVISGTKKQKSAAKAKDKKAKAPEMGIILPD